MSKTFDHGLGWNPPKEEIPELPLSPNPSPSKGLKDLREVVTEADTPSAGHSTPDSSAQNPRTDSPQVPDELREQVTKIFEVSRTNLHLTYPDDNPDLSELHIVGVTLKGLPEMRAFVVDELMELIDAHTARARLDEWRQFVLAHPLPNYPNNDPDFFYAEAKEMIDYARKRIDHLREQQGAVMTDTLQDKFGIMWEDENALVTPFCDTEDEAWEYYDQSGESRDGYYCRKFTPEEQKEAESWPEI